MTVKRKFNSDEVRYWCPLSWSGNRAYATGLRPSVVCRPTSVIR